MKIKTICVPRTREAWEAPEDILVSVNVEGIYPNDWPDNTIEYHVIERLIGPRTKWIPGRYVTREDAEKAAKVHRTSIDKTKGLEVA